MERNTEKLSLLLYAWIFVVLHSKICLAVNWTWTIGGGVFTGTESISGTTISGTESTIANAFKKLTLTGGAGTGHPGNGSISFPIEIPGYYFIAPPILTTETQASVSVVSGSCPNESTIYNWVFGGWTGGANDTSSSDQAAAGIFSYNPGLGTASITNLYNVTSYTNPSWFAGSYGLTVGSCAAGAINVTYETPNTDRSGNIYLSENGGFVYKTDANRTVFGMKQKRIPSAASLYNSYAAYLIRYDSDGDAATNIKPVSATISSNGSTGSGAALSDVENLTSDGSYGAISITVDAVNSPVDGMIQATLTRSASSGKMICSAMVDARNILFCAMQSEFDNSIPSNLILVSQSKVSGLLDHSWGSDGLLLYDAVADGYHTVFISSKSDSNGFVTGAGNRGIPSATAVVVSRFDNFGQLDTSFGSSGLFSMAIGAGSSTLSDHEVQSDGKIVAAGLTEIDGRDHVLVIRLLSDGTLDTSFNSTGIYTRDYGSDSNINDVYIDSDSKIFATGYRNNYGIGIVLKLNTDGTLDSTFDSDGLTETGAGYGDYVLQDSDGKYLVSGILYSAQNYGMVRRYLSDGTLDSTFDSDGVRWVWANGSTGQYVDGMALDHNNKILVTGGVFWGTEGNWDRSNDMAVWRLNTDGSYDTSFGTGGVALFGKTHGADGGWTVHVDRENRILVTGHSENVAQTGFHGSVARLLTNGNLDTSFGLDGSGMQLLGADAYPGANYQFGGDLDTDGRILISGSLTSSDGTIRANIIRFFP